MFSAQRGTDFSSIFDDNGYACIHKDTFDLVHNRIVNMKESNLNYLKRLNEENELFKKVIHKLTE